MDHLYCWIDFDNFIRALRELGYHEGDEIFKGALAMAFALNGSMANYKLIYQQAIGLCALARNSEQMYGIAAFALSFWPMHTELPNGDVMLSAVKRAINEQLIPASILPALSK